MVFPGLLTPNDRTSSHRSKSSTDSDFLPEFIHDELQLPCIPPERPDLRELNNCLEALAPVFPDIQVEVFRELLGNFDGESRLALVADTLLKNRVEWVKGRWRVLANNRSEEPGSVPRSEVFRSPEYKKAVMTLAWHEFKGLSKATINGVLAESNYSYLDARQTLATLSSKSWRFTLSSFILRRKPIATGEAENHPLVIWRSSGQGSIIPTIKATGSSELDRELFNTLIVPLRRREDDNRTNRDRNLAILLNTEEAEKAKATHECVCCFMDQPFEQFTQCNTEGHMICYRCVQRSIKEALFGQGWQSSIHANTGTLHCVAVDGDGCKGLVPYDYIYRAMAEDSNGADILHKLDQRLADFSLVASKLPLIRCPFCSYAEVDEIYVPKGEHRLRLRVEGISSMMVLLFCALISTLLAPLYVIFSVGCLILGAQQSYGRQLPVCWEDALSRHRRRKRGLKFTCQRVDCKRASCLSCQKSWADIHVCNESSLVALRTQVEQAMSMAIKRVCPRCNTSFVKNAGCNKLACPCGYKMCYVCRADLSDEGYRHFCEHFRPDGDPKPCKECDRCNLWENENTDLVLQQAREEAERRWKETEKRDLSVTERSFLQTGFVGQRRERLTQRIFSKGWIPTSTDVLDLLVETLYV